MTDTIYTSGRTVDPYNDFLSDGGKLWPRVKEVAGEVGLHGNLRAVSTAVREAGSQVFFVPHRCWESGDLQGWDHPKPHQLRSAPGQVSVKGSWSGEWHPDFAPRPGGLIVKEHLGREWFCEYRFGTTAKFAVEPGYHITLVRDTTATFSNAAMQAAHEFEWSDICARDPDNGGIDSSLPKLWPQIRLRRQQ